MVIQIASFYKANSKQILWFAWILPARSWINLKRILIKPPNKLFLSASCTVHNHFFGVVYLEYQIIYLYLQDQRRAQEHRCGGSNTHMKFRAQPPKNLSSILIRNQNLHPTKQTYLVFLLPNFRAQTPPPNLYFLEINRTQPIVSTTNYTLHNFIILRTQM